MDTPYSKAWRAFTNSPEWRVARELSTLIDSGPARHNTYLENRLRNAFDAGWVAAHEAKAPPPSEVSDLER